MSKHTAGRLFIGARLVVACTTLLLLTVTIMQRQDGDGYQATHLFFMPRETWEMDHGRQMLYSEEYYHDMDMQALTVEVYGPSVAESLTSPSPEAHVLNGLTSTSHSQSPAFRRLPYAPNLAGNTLPLNYELAALAPFSSHSSAVGEPVLHPNMWKGDIPSPPPRALDLL